MVNLHDIILLLILFQAKHFLADYPLQTPYMLRKFLPGWDFVKPLMLHAGVHAIFTFAIVLFYKSYVGWPIIYIFMPLALVCALIDFTLHFVMDRIKASPGLLGRYKALAASEFKSIVNGSLYVGNDPELLIYKNLCQEKLKSNTYFWWALGLDQGVHHLTHYLLIYIMVTR